MGYQDSTMKVFFSDPYVFADIFNFWIYAIMAIEAQTDVDYSMAARAMIYDGRQYEKQLDEIRKKHERAVKQLEEKWKLRKFTEDDRLTPVITLIVYLGPTAWNGPRTLHDLLMPQDPVLLKHTADYRLNLIEPFAMSEEEIDRFQSDMREVLLYIKASENKEYLKQLSGEQRFRKVSVSAARVINKVTKSQLTINEEEEEIDVCKAIQEMREEERTEGRKEGRKEGKGSLILTFMEKRKCDLETALEFFNIELEEREGIVRYVEAN